MKKAFSLIEVIIAIVILSVVMIALLKIKSENIFLVSKSNENTKANEYILLAVDFKDEILNKNEDIFLDKKYQYLNNINTTIFSRTYSLENSNIKKRFIVLR